ncbi:ommochrome-binding protein-like [Anticarsia gemmatalis]|uniref:ommochrome-binding protein-like n=1 Tax=Anticarsia gemmatalis TaxID=129554 RepID=UPI003F75CB18
MMKLFFAITLLAFAEAGLVKPNKECITIGTNVYEEEILMNNVPSPYQLAIDYNTNTLFFSYSYSSSIPFKIVYQNLKTHEHGLVNGINSGFATAVAGGDGISHTVYMGGNDGLYAFNYYTKNATRIAGLPDISIWQMFYKDGLYFTTYPHEKVFFYKSDELIEVPELREIKVMVLAVKNNGDYVYCNSSGLFTYDKTLKKTVFLGDYVANGFTADIDGNLYFSTPGGIFYIDDKKGAITGLAMFESIYGVAVDKIGAIVYGTDDSVRRLRPTKADCAVNTDLNLTENEV